MTANFTKLPVSQWLQQIEQLDMPFYETTFSAIISTLLSLLLGDSAAGSIINALAAAFKLPAEDMDFLLDHYLPTIRSALADVNLSILQKLTLTRAFVGTLIKLLYAFVWQERVFPNPFFLKPGVNELGATLMPVVNSLANTITGFKHYDAEIQASKNIYPGDTFCRVNQSHSKWHEQSANGLLDLVYMADKIKGVIKASKSGMLDSLEDDLPAPLTAVELVEWGNATVAKFGPEASKLVQSAQDSFVHLDADGDGMLTWEDILAHVERHETRSLPVKIWDNIKSTMASWF